MDNVKEYIVGYIQKEYTIPEDTDILTLNYVDSGYIDSLGMLQFITTIEDEFNVEFSDEDLQNPDIKVVGMLIDIVKSKMGE